MQLVKDILELMYFLSGPVIALIAFIALGHIKVARQQLEEQKRALAISSKRDALKITSDQISTYSSTIIPLLGSVSV